MAKKRRKARRGCKWTLAVCKTKKTGGIVKASCHRVKRHKGKGRKKK